MKRTIAAALALSLTMLVCGCAEKPEAQSAMAVPETDSAASARTGPESAPVEWEYELTTQTESREYTNDNGVLLVTWSYERPALGCKTRLESPDDLPLPDKPEEMEKACKAFNDAISGYEQNALEDLEGMKQDAQELYEERDPEYRFFAFESQVTVEQTRLSGDLAEVMLSDYGYWGGAHGGMSCRNLHFDLKTGEFVELNDLTDRPAELRQTLAWEILEQIYGSGEWEGYFDDFAETLQNKTEYNVSFGEDHMTVYFEQYEIAPYVMGIPEYEIPYAKLSRFLNERGQRLLALSAEGRALGDYYEAEELWSWREGGAPQDWEDTRTYPMQTAEGSWDAGYARVDRPGVSTLDALRKLLLTRFSDELVDRMLGPDESGYRSFREFDGVLYSGVGDRGDDITIASVDYAVTFNDGKTGGTVTATIHRQDYDEATQDWVLTGETDTLEFPFELTETGARFTSFESVY